MVDVAKIVLKIALFFNSGKGSKPFWKKDSLNISTQMWSAIASILRLHLFFFRVKVCYGKSQNIQVNCVLQLVWIMMKQLSLEVNVQCDTWMLQ